MKVPALILAVTLAGGSAWADGRSGPQGVAAQDVEIAPMAESRFWSIINATSALETDPEQQASALKTELSQLSADEVVAFQAEFDRLLRKAYRWDLWAVAYIAHGGASDDGFEYFRRWLISKGQSVFERVLANPDDLADVAKVVSMGPDGAMEFEEFFYVGSEVWAEKSGTSPSEMPGSLENKTDGAGPQGEPFPEDPGILADRYPKTWAAFGETPLL